MPNNYKLYYFDVRNLAEPLRLILNYVKQDFEDIRITHEEWSSYKIKMPHGRMPVLEFPDGKKLSQTFAIGRYLGNKYHLAGSNHWEKTLVNEIADFHKDVLTEMQPYLKVVGGHKDGDKEILREIIFKPLSEKYFPIYDRLLTTNTKKSSWIADTKHVTYVDFFIADFFYTIRGLAPEYVATFPAIGTFIEKVYALPGVINYVAIRPRHIF